MKTNQAAIRRSLTILKRARRKLSEEVDVDGKWLELKEDLDEVIRELENELSKQGPDLDLKSISDLIHKVAWIIEFLFDLTG